MNRLLGRRDFYKPDGTGVRTYYILFIPVWKTRFVHSTWMER
jgi:hypothetical protein